MTNYVHKLLCTGMSKAAIEWIVSRPDATNLAELFDLRSGERAPSAEIVQEIITINPNESFQRHTTGRMQRIGSAAVLRSMVRPQNNPHGVDYPRELRRLQVIASWILLETDRARDARDGIRVSFASVWRDCLDVRLRPIAEWLFSPTRLAVFWPLLSDLQGFVRSDPYAVFDDLVLGDDLPRRPRVGLSPAATTQPSLVSTPVVAAAMSRFAPAAARVAAVVNRPVGQEAEAAIRAGVAVLESVHDMPELLDVERAAAEVVREATQEPAEIKPPDRMRLIELE